MSDTFGGYQYRPTAGHLTDRDIVGYDVEATDGSIGSVDKASNDTDAHRIVVDTGPWIFGHKVMLPAGVISQVSHEDKKIFVDRTKDQIKESPRYDEDADHSPEYREQVGTYYNSTYGNRI